MAKLMKAARPGHKLSASQLKKEPNKTSTKKPEKGEPPKTNVALTYHETRGKSVKTPAKPPVRRK